MKRDNPVVQVKRSHGVTVALGLSMMWLAGCAVMPKDNVQGGLDAEIRGYRDQAVQLRGLPLRNEVKIEQETSAALKTALEKEIGKPENQILFSDTELLLKRFRILQETDSLQTLFLRFMQEQVAAYYDPEERRLAYLAQGAVTNQIATNLMSGVERFVYVHEFCHAIEDSHFDLKKLAKDSQFDFDRSQALTCLLEGDAVLVGLDGSLEGFPVNTATPFVACGTRLIGRNRMDELAKQYAWCPPFLMGALVRPYLDGMIFCNRIRRDAGWNGIDQVYRTRLPQTTAEILYPERRYLKGFRPAVFTPEEALFREASDGVATNSLGVLGTALWLGGAKMATPREYGFLEGWLGDQVYLMKGTNGPVQTIWMSYWERPGQAVSFRRHVESRLRKRFADASWSVRREGRLVVAVWSPSSAARGMCEAQAACALRTRVVADRPSLLVSWWQDVPWPLRFPAYKGHSAGCEVVGGWVADLKGGPAFYRVNLASTLLLNVEETPDRHHVSAVLGLFRHVGDLRSDFTYWKIPLLASWFRCGHEASERYQWSTLWGLLAYGNEKQARVLFIPVWRNGKPATVTPGSPSGTGAGHGG